MNKHIHINIIWLKQFLIRVLLKNSCKTFSSPPHLKASSADHDVTNKTDDANTNDQDHNHNGDASFIMNRNTIAAFDGVKKITCRTKFPRVPATRACAST